MWPGRRRENAPAWRIAVLVLAFLGASGCAHPTGTRNYAREADSLGTSPDSARALQLFRSWMSAHPSDPEAYVTEANFWATRALDSRVLVSTKKPEGDDLSLNDPKTGRVVGSISEVPAYDSVMVRKATDCLSRGIARFPYRLDFYFGQAHLDQAIGDYKAELRALEAAVAVAKRHPEKLRWTHGDKLDAPPGEFVPNTLHDYALQCYEMRTPAGDEQLAAIARLGSTAYPNDVKLLNDMAVYYQLNKSWSSALEWLLKAHDADSTDALVVYNIGDAYKELGDSDKAKQFLQHAITLTDDPDIKAEAQRHLAELKR